MPVYALNLFDIADADEYLQYSRRAPEAIAKHGGTVVALGGFQESVVGEIAPRQVMILVLWESREGFDAYNDDPDLADLHPHRIDGTTNYVWHLFDRLDGLGPLLREHRNP